MPRGGARPGAGRPKKQPATPAPVKKPSAKKADPAKTDAEGYKTNEAWPFGQERPPDAKPPEDLSGLMPLDFLLGVMRDQDEDKGRRLQAATLAAPYCHPKMGEGGKKDAKQAAAKKVASRYAPSAPPKLVAAGGKKV